MDERNLHGIFYNEAIAYGKIENENENRSVKGWQGKFSVYSNAIKLRQKAHQKAHVSRLNFTIESYWYSCMIKKYINLDENGKIPFLLETFSHSWHEKFKFLKEGISLSLLFF